VATLKGVHLRVRDELYTCAADASMSANRAGRAGAWAALARVLAPLPPLAGHSTRLAPCYKTA